MTIGEIVTSPGAVVLYCVLCLLVAFVSGPDLIDYLIDRYDKWLYTLRRITDRRNKR